MARTVLCWSGGKDCAWALSLLRGSGFQIAALVTTVSRSTGRVGMHDVRGELLQAQAASVGIPLWTVSLPWPCPNVDYNAAMAPVYGKALASGIDTIAFGDLYLEDVRAWREGSLDGTGMKPLFPLWSLPTDVLAREMMDAGVEARITALDARVLPPEWAGRAWDRKLLEQLPAGVDPCGENGEFHTFVTNGPMFRVPVPVRVGDTREEAGFLFTDLLPG